MRCWLVALSLMACAFPLRAVAQENFGKFQGELVVKALPDGRSLELTQPFSFIDANGKLWAVPTGTVVDGASIPGAFWSFIGGPFEDKYREASVIHDHYCNEKSDTWENVHLVFYNGMLARGVESLKAKLMYAAVYNFGPRWVEVQPGQQGGLITGQPVLLADAKDAIVKFITEQNPSLEEIQVLSRRLSEVETLEQLEGILAAHANCTPILANPGSDAALKQTIILCGLSTESKKQAAVRNLRTLQSHLSRLLNTNVAFLIPSVERYVADPTPENWSEVQKWSRDVYGLVKVGIRSTLDVQDDKVRDLAPPLDDVFSVLSTRAAMISPILEGEPKPKEDMRQWARDYLQLIQRLQTRLRALEDYLASASP
jgi:hypothetical protein